MVRVGTTSTLSPIPGSQDWACQSSQKCYAQLFTTCSNVQTHPVVTGEAAIMAQLLTRHHGLLHTPTGRFRAPGPRYWIWPANAGFVSHRETCHGADVTPHSLLRCLRIILTTKHRASNWQFRARKEISLLVRWWVFQSSSLNPANDARFPTTSG